MSDTECTENELTIGAAPRRQYEEQLREEVNREQDGTRDPQSASVPSFDTDFGDPLPPTIGASHEQLDDYQIAVDKYATDVLECMDGSGVRNEDLWIEFTCSFKEFTIRSMSPSSQIKWAQFLRRNGVYVKAQRGFARWKALQECLLSPTFKPWNSATTSDAATRETSQRQVIHNQSVDLEQVQNQDTSTPRRPVPYSVHPINPDIVGSIDPLSRPDVAVPLQQDAPQNSHQNPVRSYGNEWQGSAVNGFTNDNRGRNRPRFDRFHSGRDPANEHTTFDPSGHLRKGRIDAMMKAYASRTKFSGSFNEDFEGALEQYETLSSLCDLSDGDMAKAFPVMLTGAAFSLYTRQFSRKSLTYGALVDAFRAWYTSEEQRYRLLQIWQSPSLSREMQKQPEMSEVEVFGRLSDELTKIQHQLHSDYRKDRFLRDQLLVAADIPHVRRSLVDKIPLTAQETMQRVAALLSSEPRSAGAHLAQDEFDEAHYCMGKRFGGRARKSLRPSQFKSNRSKHPLASVKGCWVCGKDHRAREKHHRSEILDALKRIKGEKSSALYTAEHVSEMYPALVVILDTDTSNDDFDEGQEDDDVNFINDVESKDPIVAKTVMNAEVYLANASYVHGLSFATDLKKEMQAMRVALSRGECSGFDGIIVDTGTNRSSVMSHSQYKAYCEEFNIPPHIDR